MGEKIRCCTESGIAAQKTITTIETPQAAKCSFLFLITFILVRPLTCAQTPTTYGSSSDGHLFYQGQTLAEKAAGIYDRTGPEYDDLPDVGPTNWGIYKHLMERATRETVGILRTRVPMDLAAREWRCGICGWFSIDMKTTKAEAMRLNNNMPDIVRSIGEQFFPAVWEHRQLHWLE